MFLKINESIWNKLQIHPSLADLAASMPLSPQMEEPCTWEKTPLVPYLSTAISLQVPFCLLIFKHSIRPLVAVPLSIQWKPGQRVQIEEGLIVMQVAASLCCFGRELHMSCFQITIKLKRWSAVKLLLHFRSSILWVRTKIPWGSSSSIKKEIQFSWSLNSVHASDEILKWRSSVSCLTHSVTTATYREVMTSKHIFPHLPTRLKSKKNTMLLQNLDLVKLLGTKHLFFLVR